LTGVDDDAAKLAHLIRFLSASPAVADKATIHTAYAPAEALAGGIRVGDDCAAVPDGDEHLLFAAEGMLESFVAADPWFAGYSAVMVNLSDVAAMGGRPLAIVDVLWTPGLARSAEIWDGMSAASRAYGVPIVGGHTTITKTEATFLAAAVLGKARNLITSFDAKPGDDLLMVVDLRGNWRRDKPFWNASVNAPSERLRADLALLPVLSEKGWCRAGKDISNGGIVGTLAMLLECSHVGAELWLDQLPQPPDTDLERWLIAFPSYGYLLAVNPEHTAATIAHFGARGIACAPVGRITSSLSLILGYGSARAPLPLVGASRPCATSP
jgi:AIR synthase-related protein